MYKAMIIALFILSVLLGIVLGHSRVLQMDVPVEYVYYSDESLADAIYWAEGGKTTNFPYGIK